MRRYDRVEGKVEDVTGRCRMACVARKSVQMANGWPLCVGWGSNRFNGSKNIATGAEFTIYDALDKDQQEAWTVFGCYPGYAWIPENDPFNPKGYRIAIWAGGKIKQVDMSLRLSHDVKEAENVGLALKSVRDIPFTCQVKTKPRKHNGRCGVFNEQYTSKAIRQATTIPDGKWLVF